MEIYQVRWLTLNLLRRVNSNEVVWINLWNYRGKCNGNIWHPGMMAINESIHGEDRGRCNWNLWQASLMVITWDL